MNGAPGAAIVWADCSVRRLAVRRTTLGKPTRSKAGPGKATARAGDEPAAEPPAPGGRARPAKAAPGEPPAEREYLTPGEVARILHVSPKTINRWATDKLIPCIVTLGGHRRFRREDVLAVSARMSGGVDQRPGS